MKHEVTTLNTKKALSASLKKYMEQKPLSKITVSDIISDCGVNRKTFYYHFEDIRTLLKWTLEQEAIEVVKQFDLLLEYEDAMIFAMNYVDDNKHILNCAYDSMGREELKRFFYQDFIGIMRKIVDSVEKEMGLNADEALKEFVSAFYTEAIAGMLIDWFKEKGHPDRQTTIKYFALILKKSLPEILSAND